MDILPSAANAVIFDRQQFLRTELQASAVRLTSPQDAQSIRSTGDISATFAALLRGSNDVGGDNGAVIRNFLTGRSANFLA